MEDRIKALEEKFAELESRVAKLEVFTGVNDFDADYRGTSLHRSLDYLEDWRRDQSE